MRKATLERRRVSAAIAAAATLAATAALSQTSIVQERLLFADDFTTPTDMWSASDAADGVVRFEDGRLVIRANTLYKSKVVLAPAIYGDVVIEVETTFEDGTDNNWQLVTCRHESDEDFYRMGVSADGYFVISVWRDGERRGNSIGPQPSDAVKQGAGETNLLRVACVEDRLRLEINGEVAAEVRDGGLDEGRIGFAVDALDSTFSEASFDNLRVFGL